MASLPLLVCISHCSLINILRLSLSVSSLVPSTYAYWQNVKESHDSHISTQLCDTQPAHACRPSLLVADGCRLDVVSSTLSHTCSARLTQSAQVDLVAAKHHMALGSMRHLRHCLAQHAPCTLKLAFNKPKVACMSALHQTECSTVATTVNSWGLAPKHQEVPVQPVQLTSEHQTLRDLESVLGPLDNRPMVPAPKPVVIVISGPSGVGKDTVVARLKERREDLYFVVTATSRPKRPSEVEGRDYFFVTKEKFEEWIANDMLLEHALVYGDYKGIPRQQVDDALRQGTDVVLRIDVQGAATVKKLLPDAITIFVAAEDEATLVKRLVERKTESLDKLAVRVATARAEVARVHEFDYVVVNGTGSLELCVSQVSGIIDAEKAKVKNRYQQ